MQLYVTLAELK